MVQIQRILFCKHLIKLFPKWLTRINISLVDGTIHFNIQYKGFIDLCCVDYPSDSRRFKLIYHLISYRYNTRIYIHIDTTETEAISSITSIFLSSNWFE